MTQYRSSRVAFELVEKAYRGIAGNVSIRGLDKLGPYSTRTVWQGVPA